MNVRFREKGCGEVKECDRGTALPVIVLKNVTVGLSLLSHVVMSEELTVFFQL